MYASMTASGTTQRIKVSRDAYRDGTPRNNIHIGDDMRLYLALDDDEVRRLHTELGSLLALIDAEEPDTTTDADEFGACPDGCCDAWEATS